MAGEWHGCGMGMAWLCELAFKGFGQYPKQDICRYSMRNFGVNKNFEGLQIFQILFEILQEYLSASWRYWSNLMCATNCLFLLFLFSEFIVPQNMENDCRG
jgi:hypothetical protein